MNESQQTSLLTKIEERIARIEHNAFGVIYGSVTMMALLLASRHETGGPLETAAILFGSIFAIVLAETFAKISSDAVRNRRAFWLEEIKQGWVHSRPALIAANIPTALIAGSALGLYHFETSLVLAQIAAISLLAVYGYSIGWVIYRRVTPGLLHAAFTSGIGLVLALVKYIMH